MADTQRNRPFTRSLPDAEEDLLLLISAKGREWTLDDEAPSFSSVKLRISVADLARFVAGDDPNLTVTDLLSDILEPILEEMEQEIVLRRMKQITSA
jgi:hypothetical protein